MKSQSAPNRHRLNDLFISRLQPRAGAYLVWDTKQHGLVVQVQPTGHRAFKVIYSRRGRSRWYHLGDAAAIDIAAARKLALGVMIQVADGKDPAADRKASRHAGSFEELAARYLKVAKLKNKSWLQSDKLVRKHLTPKWGKLSAADISRSDVKALLAGIAAPIVSNQVKAAASAIFSWAVIEEAAGVKVNPCIGVTKNATSNRERVLSDSEVKKFWTGFEAAGLIRCMALRMVLLTGQRPGEVLHMRTEHIADGWWALPGRPVPELGWPGTKNAASHRVWLPKPAQAILAELEPDGFVFPNLRGDGAVTGIERVMQDICKKLEVERATPHDLRRTHGSMITGLGFGRDAMNRVQNHIEGGIADVYDQYGYIDENKKIMEAVANKIVMSVEGRADVVVVPFEKKAG